MISRFRCRRSMRWSRCVVAQEGVYGCKLTGAGFGGACVALLREGEGERVKQAALRAYAQRGHRGERCFRGG